MKKSAEILGLPVISVTEGSELGRSKTLLIDAHNKAVAAITIEDDDWYRGVKLIPYESVIAIGDDAVIINNSENILKLDDAGDYENLLDENIRAITKNGMIQGTVTEIGIGDGGKIEECEITMPDNEVFEVQVDQISIFGKQVTVISANMEKKTEFITPAPTEQSESEIEPAVEDVFIPEPAEETAEQAEEIPQSADEAAEELPGPINEGIPEVVEEPTEEVSEPVAEEVQEVTEEVSEPVAEEVQEVTEEVSEPVAEEIPTVTEEVSEPVAEEIPTVTEEVSEPVAEEIPTVTEEVAEPVAEEIPTVTEEVSEPVAEEIPQVAEEVSEPVAEEVQEVTEEVSEPVAEEIPTVTEEVSEPVTEEIPTVTEEVSEPVAEEIPADINPETGEISTQEAALDDIQENVQPTTEEIKSVLGDGIAAVDGETVSPEVAEAQAFLADQNLGGDEEDLESDQIPMPEIPTDIDAEIPTVVEPVPEEFMAEEMPLDEMQQISTADVSLGDIPAMTGGEIDEAALVGTPVDENAANRNRIEI